MAGVCRANLDKAGGTILIGVPSVLVDGMPIVVEGNPVRSHGDNPHNKAIMVNGNSSVTVGGIPVCTEISKASCGHRPSGSSTVFVG